VIVRLAAFFALGAILLTGCVAPVVEKTITNHSSRSPGGENYRLSPNDTVAITVFQEPDMATAQQIARDGSISVPLIGTVVVSGLSIADAQALIAKKLSEKYLVDPQVTLNVTAYAPQYFTILGQVGDPGSFPVPTSEDVFTLPMALALAKGNTRIGNLRNIKITRYEGDKIRQFTVNMLSSEGQQFQIRRGDLITVQETLF